MPYFKPTPSAQQVQAEAERLKLESMRDRLRTRRYAGILSETQLRSMPDADGEKELMAMFGACGYQGKTVASPTRETTDAMSAELKKIRGF